MNVNRKEERMGRQPKKVGSVDRFEKYCYKSNEYCVHRLNSMMVRGTTIEELTLEAGIFNKTLRKEKVNPKTGKPYHWGESRDDVEANIRFFESMGFVFERKGDWIKYSHDANKRR